jgi:AcrR family transcriptional regulator
MISVIPRARLQVDERRAQLVELGIELFSRRAYDEIAIDDIAREAGISKGLLYHYFGSKRDFYVACVRSAADQLVSRLIPDVSLPPAERAKKGVEAYLDYVENRATAYTALMRSGIGSDPEVQAILEDKRSIIVTRMLEGMGLDEPRPIFRFAARSWVGSVEAACLEWLVKREVDRKQLVKILLGSLYGTLLTAKNLDPEAPFEVVIPPPWFFE